MFKCAAPLLSQYFCKSTILYLLPLFEFGEHNDWMTPPLPHHPPEVLHCVRQGALGCDKIVLLPVALEGRSSGKQHLRVRQTSYFALFVKETMSFIYTSMGNLYRRSWGSAYINKGRIDVVGELLSSFHWEYYSVEIICKRKKENETFHKWFLIK